MAWSMVGLETDQKPKTYNINGFSLFIFVFVLLSCCSDPMKSKKAHRQGSVGSITHDNDRGKKLENHGFLSLACHTMLEKTCLS